ncbi:MAG: tetratricopeptide repeat protein [Chloroflexia bacterium]|nr:tetratricopeptide repeat protein [Chloroflexia bacterium]
MNHKIVAIFILIVANTGLSKATDLDSLKSIVNQQTKKDSMYADALIKLARGLRGQNMDSSVIYYKQAIDLSNQLDNRYLIFKSNHGIGICYGITSDYPKAIEHFNTALEFAQKISNQEAVGDCYNTFGIVYKRMSDYPTSAEYYEKSLIAYDLAKNESGKASAYSNLGVLYDLMKEEKLAKESYQKALNFYVANNVESGISTIEANLAILYVNNNQFDSAIFLLRKVIEYGRSAGDRSENTNALVNISTCYIKTNRLDSAEIYLNEAYKLALEFDLKQALADIYYNYAKISLKKGLIEKSLEYAHKNLQIAGQLNSYKYLADSEFLFSEIYEQKKDFKLALDHYKKFKDFQDSIFEENKVMAFKSQQVKMEVFEKDKELAEKSMNLAFLDEKLELEYRWKWMLAITTGLFLLLGVVYYRKFMQKKKYSTILEDKNAEIRAQNEAIEEINIQLESKMLRAQINPHFIFNALSAIQHFITINDKKSALTFLSKFSSLLRQVLESSINVNMLLKDEIELLNIYLELEALRFSDGFDYEISVDENLDIYLYEIPTLLIQPFIEMQSFMDYYPRMMKRN